MCSHPKPLNCCLSVWFFKLSFYECYHFMLSYSYLKQSKGTAMPLVYVKKFYEKIIIIIIGIIPIETLFFQKFSKK